MPRSRPPPLPQRVVGIGASAGGLDALKQLISHVPAHTGLAFVVQQHLPPSEPGALASLLAACTTIPVTECRASARIIADTIVVVPPRSTATLSRGRLTIRVAKAGSRPRLPIDALFESLAAALGDRAIGIVLSGTGHDGTEGLRAIQTAGGLTFAQEPSSARFDEMPHSAIAASVAEIVLDAEKIGRELSALALVIPGPATPGATTNKTAAVDRILGIVRDQVGVDFTSYKRTTIERRIARRVLARKPASVIEYAAIVEAEPQEARALYEDLLIHVTEFFRDRVVLDVLVQQVLRSIVRDRPRELPVRVWIPGCSTGEEVYSLAILLLELLDDRVDQIQLFGTDLSERVIEVARKGVYPKTIAAQVGTERLGRYFDVHEDGYRIKKEVRGRCVFVHHDLLADPPFSRLDLISCRNVLIYLVPELQRKVLRLFHYALEHPGYLVLGRTETIAGSESLFSTIDGDARIYSRKPGKGTFKLATPTAGARYPLRSRGDSRGSTVDIEREVDHVLLARYAPACVLVDENLEVMRFRGRTSPYLEQPPGPPQQNLLRLAREGLATELPAALQRARTTQQAVRTTAVLIRGEHGERRIHLGVLPLTPLPGRKQYFLIVFEEPAPAREPTTPAKRAGKGKRPVRASSELERVRRELAETKEYLQTLVTQHLAISEELGISNEELQSTNEELASSNEELQTAKEELQSTNEELETVNDALRTGNEQLHVVNDDLINVLASTDFAIIIVDTDRLVRRFTPKAQLVMKLREHDVGRPIADLQPHVQMKDLDGMISRVIESLQMAEAEVRHIDGAWYRMQIRPYRTSEGETRGAVIAFVDITSLRAAREQASNIVETVPTPLAVVDSSMAVVSTNRAFRRELERDLEQAGGSTLFDIGSWESQETRTVLAAAIRDRTAVGPLLLPHRGNRGSRVFRVEAKPMPGSEAPGQVLIGLTDVTAEMELDRVHESERRQRDSFLNAVSHELRTPLAAITLWAEALRDLPSDATMQAHAIRMILESAAAEAELVDDLIELALSRETSLSIGIENVDVAEAIDKAVGAAKRSALAKHIRLECALEADARAIADPRRVRQIVGALLSNAIKFSPDGGTVAVASTRDKQFVLVSVRDTGPGIPPELASRIFDPLWQADRSNTRSHEGLGIGLALVRHLAEQQGGSIVLSPNDPPPGSTFVLSLPIATA